MFSPARIIRSHTLRTASIARPATIAPLQNRLFHATRPAMTVQVVTTADEFRQAVANNKVVIVDSYADWCPPCKAIAPILEKHSNSDEFKDKVHFVKFDVDKIPEISQELRVSSIPAFFFFKDGKQVDNFVGANPAELQRLLKTHSA
ncbi:cytoplasmic thioredoxin, putative [Cordyceps militaris]|uniref:Cytoplasmic thioredoxin, putative n=1 Tax=Cordyceps militaris TaxID=73501 RepID=A0A2H4SKN9_CORMI|nr:cytoplasmic thioredoxin, putative [Cordyceps militaris]